MIITSAERAAFEPQWQQDVNTLVLSAPCTFSVGDTIKLCETVSGVTTGRYILSTVTAVTPLSAAFVTVQQTIMQRAQQ